MTARLLALAKHHWAKIDGSRQDDPLLLPPDRFFNLVYFWATKDAYDQKDLDKFERQLWRPPKGVAAAPGSPWSPEAETQAFQAFAAEFNALAGGKIQAPGEDA